MKFTPNIITLSRLIIPVLIIISYESSFFFLGTVLLVIGLLSDALDGYIARRFNKGTDVGIFLDQFIDKIFVHSLLLYFLTKGYISFLIVLIIILRDHLAVAIRYFGVLNGQVIKSIWSGKLKLWLQGVLLIFITLHLVGLISSGIVNIFGTFTAVWSAVSLLHFMLANRITVNSFFAGLRIDA